MMALLHFFNIGAGRAAEFASGALIAAVWQGIALAAVTCLVLRLVPKTTASARFLIWVAVFVVSAGMPVVHLYGDAAAGVTGSGARFEVDARWSYLLAGLWACAVVVRLGMLALQTVGLRGLWKSAVPIKGMEFEELRSGRRVQVCASSKVDRPSVIGFFAPKVLIPEWLLAQLTEVELRHIVLHEMEHLRRRDDWINLFQKIGLVLFPLNPALFWIDRRLSVEREIACDDGVLERTKTPRAYAASLTSIAERRLGLRMNRRMVALALGMFGVGAVLRRRSEFARRIENILGRRAAISPRFAAGLAAVLVAVIVGAAAVMMRAPELVSFGRGAAVATSIVPTVAVARQPLPAMKAMPEAVYRDASLRFAAKVVPAGKPAVVHAAPVETKAVAPVRRVEVKSEQPRKRQGQLMVLTTWEHPSGLQRDGDEVPVSRVVMRMPDGRFYVAPYAAVPTQAGWLIVQL